MKNINSTKILDVRVDLVSTKQALDQASQFLESKESHYITTPNVEIIMQTQNDTKLLTAINQADLNLVDSSGVAWAVQRYTGHKPERVTGVDFAYQLLEFANSHAKKVLIVSRSDGLDAKSAHTAVEKLQSHFLQARLLAYVYNISQPSQENLNQINKFQADIILLGLGTPLEDYWAHENRAKLTHPAIVLCCGGTVDFMAGVQKRAPERVRKLGLEWLWRLVKQPNRLKRQMVIPAFVRQVKKQSKKS